MNTDEEKQLKILDVAKKCRSRIFKIVQQFFNAESLHQDLATYLATELGYQGKEALFRDAVWNNSLPLVKLYFLITSTNINTGMKHRGITYLNWAVIHNRKSIVEYLLTLGADMEIEDKIGLTALQTALSRVKTEIAQFLLFKKYTVVLTNAIEVIEFLVDKPTDFYTKGGCSMLLIYALKISKDALRLVLSSSPIEDIFVQWPDGFIKDTLTYVIVKQKSKSLLKLIIEKIENLDSCTSHYEQDVIHIAAENNPEMIPVLIGNAELRDYAGDFYEQRVGTLGILYDIQKPYVINILEKCGVDVYDKMPSDHNELYHWCFYGADIGVFLYEMEKGVNINHLNYDNLTPLEFALEGFYVYYELSQIQHLVSIIAKMIENREFINEDNYMCLEDGRVEDYYNECKEELCRLRKKKLTEVLSYYDFLTGNHQKLTELARRKVMSSVPCRDKLEFPIYYRHLERNVERSIWRMREMKRIYKITEPWMPHLISDNICGYLNDKQLRKSKYYFKSLAEQLFKS